MAQFTKKQLKRTLIATIIICVIVAGLILGVFLKSYLSKTNLLKDQDFAAALADKLGVSVRGLSQDMLDKYQYCRLSFSAYDQTNGITGYSYLILGDETYAEAMLAQTEESEEEAEEVSADTSADESAEESSAAYTEDNYIVLFNVVPQYAEDYAAFRNLKVLSVLDSYDISQISYDISYASYIYYYQSGGSQLGWNTADIISALSLQKINDLSAFTTLKDLRYLSLANSSVKSLEGLDKLPALEYLDVSRTNVSAIPAGSATLKTMIAADNSIEDISGLASCEKLEVVALDSNKVTDISALSGLNELKVVSLTGNKIKSLSPLKDHAKIE
ncbi:MAG: leucine-rich repeat domain-containing protein, partial [Clostridia bacterium]|nr:leucine-rich repeat domain-containing protein [Clostridia bacterium]